MGRLGSMGEGSCLVSGREKEQNWVGLSRGFSVFCNLLFDSGPGRTEPPDVCKLGRCMDSTLLTPVQTEVGHPDGTASLCLSHRVCS